MRNTPAIYGGDIVPDIAGRKMYSLFDSNTTERIAGANFLRRVGAEPPEEKWVVESIALPLVIPRLPFVLSLSLSGSTYVCMHPPPPPPRPTHSLAADLSNEFRGTISIRTGFQSLFGYIKHVIQLLGRHDGIVGLGALEHPWTREPSYTPSLLPLAKDIRRHMRTCAKAICRGEGEGEGEERKARGRESGGGPGPAFETV